MHTQMTRPILVSATLAVAMFATPLTSAQRVQAAGSHLRLPAPADARKPISSLPFTIDECGSYFLTGCLTGAAGQDGITIAADDVTIDLNGFSLTGVPGSLDGIARGGNFNRWTVQNGNVTAWGGDGIDLFSGVNNEVTVERVRSSGNGGRGIVVAGRAIVRDCVATNNGNSGIVMASNSANSIIDSCVGSHNTNSGIQVTGSAGTVRGCSANHNTGSGIGASAGGGWSVVENTCYSNDQDGNQPVRRQYDLEERLLRQRRVRRRGPLRQQHGPRQPSRRQRHRGRRLQQR